MNYPAEICLGEECNNRCLMCTNPDSPWDSRTGPLEKFYSKSAIIKRVEDIRKDALADKPIYLSGGEPTINPHLLSILKQTRRLFPDNEIRLLTNARRFFYKDFTKKVLETDNLRLVVSLCGPTAKVHDEITRVEGSFNQTATGLDNILSFKRESQTVEIRTVISKLSYKHLPYTLSLIRNRFPSVESTIIIFMEMEGQAKKNIKQTAVSYRQFCPYWRAIEPFFSVINDLRLYHFPLCTVPPRFWRYTWRTLPSHEVTFIKVCQKCRYKKHCLGIHKEYLEHMDSQEFKPPRARVSITEGPDFYRPIAEIK